jgi:anaerobic ribonucleoside-triphosphate reductase
MKRTFFLVMLFVLPLWGWAQNQVTVDVYYFHVTNRCHTCLSIEEQVHKTLDTYFKSQMENDEVKLFIYNCELPENKAIAEKYLAYGSTLAITRHQQGKEATEDITGWAFQKIGKPEVFVSELKQKIENALKP